MAPFIGEASATIDDKNRLTLPKKFRQLLNVNNAQEGETYSIYLMPGANGADLAIMDQNRGREMLLRFESKRRAGPNPNMRSNRIGGLIERVVVDKSGRALVPATLLKTLKIDAREFVITGAFDYFEVFTKAKWEAEQAKIDADALSEMWSEFHAEPALATDDTTTGAPSAASTSSAS